MRDIDSSKPDGLILAGGKSSRFGSPKATYILRDHRLIDWVAVHMRPVVAKMFYSCGVSPYDLKDATAVKDRVYDRGPLEGLATGFLKSDSEWILVCPVDMPLVDSFFFEKLLDARTPDLQAIISQDDDAFHPLCGVFRRSLLTSIEEAIACSRFRVLDWIETLDYATVLGQKDMLQNFNRPPRDGSAFH